MITTPSDLILILQRIEAVKSSKLINEDQQITILGELRNALPPSVLCAPCKSTLEIITGLLDGYAATKQDPHQEEETDSPQAPKGKTKGTESKLLHGAGENPRGKSVAKAVVNKTKDQRRQTTRSS